MKALLPLALLILPLHAQTLGALATFTEEENATNWGFYTYATNETFPALWTLPDNDTDDTEIYGAFTDDNGVSFFADTLPSDSSFVGDYASAEIDTVSCDIYVEDLDSFDYAEFIFIAGGVEYSSDIFFVGNAGWSNLTASFSKDQWYFIDTNNEFAPVTLTPTILSEVVEIGVNYFPSSTEADGKLVALDNFAILPDLTAPILKISQASGELALSFDQIEGLSYDLEMSTTLQDDDWSLISNDTFNLQGLGTYETTLTPVSKSFFRVVAYPLFIELP